MRVSSPIGELPFVPERARIDRGGLPIEGRMGAWPAHVRIDAADLPALARLMPLRPLGATTAATALAAVVVRRTRRNRP